MKGPTAQGPGRGKPDHVEPAGDRTSTRKTSHERTDSTRTGKGKPDHVEPPGDRRSTRKQAMKGLTAQEPGRANRIM
ncbi:hypothetical protein RRG08_065306 [Elysia crispata]|uniref:Uncharacterized protein n=1 Tax=Elysia crispata TaxID=231223 RepID=A0AAE1D472_9GAST|nr:hypothetical protein RRG08_065306 [Elysia crispata]